MNDLFGGRRPGAKGATVPEPASYSAKDIEVLEGLEPVRRRPGMYIGGTDESALHHLAAEILDNAMDEAVAGHADRIEVDPGSRQLADGARQRPRHPDRPAPEIPQAKSALEVILTTLHSGGKFSGKAYETSGGLHGVGFSVVNALSERLEVEVARDRSSVTQAYSRGKPLGKLKNAGPSTTAAAPPSASGPTRRSSARWNSPPRGSTGSAGPRPISTGASRSAGPAMPRSPPARRRPGRAAFPRRAGRLPRLRHRGPQPGGPRRLCRRGELPGQRRPLRMGGHLAASRATASSRPTPTPSRPPQGGTHEAGLRAALVKGLRAYGELKKDKRAAHRDRRGSVRRPRRHAQRLRAGPAIPGPDQGEADQPGSQPAGRSRPAGPFRPLAGRRPDHRRQPAGLGDRARRGPHPPARAEGHPAQIRDPQAAPARQAGRLLARERRWDRAVPGRGRQRRRLGQAGAGPRDPGGAAAPRQDPERRQRQRRQAAAATRS